MTAKSVLELGTGTGLLGIFCYMKMKAMGRKDDFKMTLTDLEKPSLDITIMNLDTNGVDKSLVDVQFCRWG